MKLHFFPAFLAFLFVHSGIAQISFIRYDSIPVVVDGQALPSAWAGGLNSPQFSEIDLDGDGTKDLFAFERSLNGSLKTFINEGTPNKAAYRHAHQFRSKFPILQNWALLADYNCDGKEDIFTEAPGGVAVYRNDFNATEGLRFTLVSSLLQTQGPNGLINLFVPPADIPAITDIDNDGDLDLLTFGVSGTLVEFHKNNSMENNGNCDSLSFVLQDACWGRFAENGLNNDIILGVSCLTGGGGYIDDTKSGRHSGSTLLAIDLDGDLDKELILGDISFSNMVMVTNGGSPNSAAMNAVDTEFPSNSVPVDLAIFPASFYLDVNNDGKKDYLAVPNNPNASENFTSVWYYQNTGTETVPVFTYQKNNFLQDEMIEVGTGAHPAFVDIDADGLLDLLIGNNGYFNPTGNPAVALSLYRNVGTTSSPSFEFVTRDYAGLEALSFGGIYPTFGDLDGDGDEDMMVGDQNGMLHFFQNTAEPANPANFVLNEPNFKGIDIGQSASPQLVDVNRDGKLDLLIGEKSGTLNYFENIGTPSNPDFSATPTNDFWGGIDVMVACCTGFSAPFLVEDNEGNYVLLVGSEKGYLFEYTNIDGNLEGNFDLADSLLLQGINISISGGDLDNDGKLEFAYGECAGGVGILKQDNPTVVATSEPSDNSLDFKIYPNPSHGKIFIDFSDSNFLMDATIEIFNSLGKRIRTQSFNSNNQLTLDLSGTPPGIYFCKITSQKGDSFAKKIALH